MKDRKWLWWICGAGLAVRLAAWFYFRSHTLALVTARLPDDALYYFTIARNLASGHGISFDGIHPTNGMHPLWLLIITPVFWLGLSKWGAIHAIILLQSALDVGVVWLIGSTVYKFLPGAEDRNRQSAAAMAALLYALSPIALLRGINGLETTLATLLLLLWLRAYFRIDRGVRQWVVLGLVSGLLLLARTDMFLVLIPLALYRIGRIRRIGQIGREWAGIGLTTLVAFLIVVPWLIWNILYFGTIVQSSAEAVPMLAMRKYHALYGYFILNYWHLVLDAGRNALKPFWLAAFGVPLLTIGYAWRRLRHPATGAEAAQQQAATYWMVFGGVLLLVVHSIFRGFIRDWYVAQLIPVFLVAFGVSIGANAGRTAARPGGRYTLAAVVIVLQFMFYWRSQYISQAAMVQSGVPVVERLTERYKVASFNAGYYGYFASRPGSVVNIDGVVNSDALDALKSGRLGAYLERDSVSYILDFRGDFGGYINLIDRHLLDDFVLETQDSSSVLVLYRHKSLSGPKLLPLTQ